MSKQKRQTQPVAGEKGIATTKNRVSQNAIHDLAGETRFEHATYGFGDRYSTVEPLP